MVCPSYGIAYKVSSISSQQINVSYQLDSFEIKNALNRDPILFGFSIPATSTYTVSVSSDNSTQVSAIPVTILSKGFCGTSNLQWISFLPYSVSSTNDKNAVNHGTISIRFTSSAINPNQNFSIKNGIMRFSTQTPLQKIASISRQELPSRSGLRMFIDEDGIYELKFSDLRKLGVPIDNIPLQYFKIYCKNVEIPCLFSQASQLPVGNDNSILFFAQSLRGTTTYYSQFSKSNVYWLTWQTDRPGQRIAEVSGAKRRDITSYQGLGVKSIAAKDFFDTVHCEQDNILLSLGNSFSVQDMADSSQATITDQWYWGEIGSTALTDFSFDLPSPTVSMDQSFSARLRIRLQGVTNDPNVPFDHKIAIYLNSDTLGVAQWDGQTQYDFTSSYFPSSKLLPGQNKITFNVLQTQSQIGTDLSLLNWIDVEYYRTFNTNTDELFFKNNSSDVNTALQFSITGLTKPFVDLWDLTMNRFYSGFSIETDASHSKKLYSVVFQDTLTKVHSFLCQTTDKRLYPRELKLDTIKTDWDQVAKADYIVVTVDSFFAAFSPFVDMYKAKNMNVALVNISDVYNSFSFGIRDPESIRLLMQYLYQVPSSNKPRYLLLGGDCTQGLDKIYRDRNIVPTHLSQVPGWGPAADDGYFSTIIGDDNFPDLYVGRFPANTISEIKNIVDKTISYQTKQVNGPWHDNLLLVGGAEPDFTTFNDQMVSEVIGAQMNITRLDGDPTSKFYRDATTASKDMAGYINAGTYAINFNGHGGGLVWSDSKFFSYSDLTNLYNGQWDKAGRLPLVFSFTCLTGFFESPIYRSLGEEFVRIPKNGAIGFFGASGYTSKRGNLIMNRMFLENGLNGNFESIGELLWLCKTTMLAEFGSEYLPLIREYNLLGDPALPWKLAPVNTMTTTLAKQSLGSKDSLLISGNCATITKGQVKTSIGADYMKWNDYSTPVLSNRYSLKVPLKDSINTSHGYVHSFAWNDSVESRSFTSFSKNNILFSQVSVLPKQPCFGDSVVISATITTPDSSQKPQTILCLYAIASRSISSPTYNGVSMNLDSSGNWLSNGKIPLLFHGNPGEELLLKFRVIGTGISDTTELYTFPIKGRPDLLFTGNGPRMIFLHDSLFIQGEILNAGTMSCPGFTMAYYSDTLQSKILFSIPFKDSLAPGKSRLFGFSIPDTQGTVAISLQLNPEKKFDEINLSNNIASVKKSIVFADLFDSKDSLFSSNKGLVIHPNKKLSSSYRVFLFTDTIGSKFPISTESYWVPLEKDSIKQFSIGTRPSFKQSDSLLWTFFRSGFNTDSQKKTDVSSSAKLCFCTYDPQINSWRFFPSVSDTQKSKCISACQNSGPFALASLSDIKPPQIRASVYGREILFLDYAAKGKPFNLFISDQSGIIPSSITVSLNNQALDTSLVSKVASQPDLKELSITAYPKKEYSIDSLSVTAQDFAGNSNTAVFAYMAGEDLTIKHFSCHPNPFSAKQDNALHTLQTIRFAFLITDVAKDASIVIYTIANRVIWKWEKTDGIIGYQEVPWDGKTSQGYRIANGTYYAKLTVKNDSKKVTSIIRIAKLEGY